MKTEVKEKYLAKAFEKYEIIIAASTLHKLALISEQVNFPRGSMVLGVNQTQSAVDLITQGLARSYVTDEKGNDIVRNLMLEQDFLLGESLFSNTSIESFDAIEDLYCLKFDADTLKQIIMENDQLKTFYIKALEATLQYKMNREYGFQNLDAKGRYEAFQKLFGSAEKRIPQNQIASYIGIKKESLSRLRRKIQNR